MWRLVLFYICLSITSTSRAQMPVKNKNTSNLRKKMVPARQAIVALDTLSIIPNSFFVPGISDTSYTIDYVNGTLYWKNTLPYDSVLVNYRVFNLKLNAVTKHLNYDSIRNNFAGNSFVHKDGSTQRDELFFNFGNINYAGSFGRGISFGNSQDAVVTSNLNLQLNGLIGDSIQIAAAITDSNIPIQPDGTTQQLNEFDRVFLEFKKKSWKLSLGDIDLRQNKSYFLNFYKRLQGARLKPLHRLRLMSLTQHLSADQLLRASLPGIFLMDRKETRALIG